MKKIMCATKICLGIGIVMVAAYWISSFDGFLGLLLGTSLMLAGVALGVFLEKRSSRFFFILSLLSLLPTFLINSHLQYFTGGFLIYFSSAMIFDRKNLLFLEILGKIC